MTKTAFVLIFLFTSLLGYAQQDYFVLIQSDNNQPFYAKVKDKIYTSSDIGHLIIPQLTDSIYTLVIGFPKKAFPDQKFTLAINRKEAGFQLKNLGDKGWALYNWQSLVLNMSEKDSTKPGSDSPLPSKNEDSFSKLMAGVVNDTAVMYNSYTDIEPKSEPIQKDPVKPNTQKKDNNPTTILPEKDIAKTEPVVNKDIKKDTLESNNIKQSPKTSPKEAVHTRVNAPDLSSEGTAPISPYVKKITEQSLDTALLLVYADVKKNGTADTIVAIIPTAYRPVNMQPKDGPAPIVSNSSPTPLQSKADSVKADSSSTPYIKPTKKIVVNTRCKDFATDYDVDKLRVKLMAADNIDDKILDAKKIFRSKCFTTKQVQSLSEAFTDEESRYTFFETVYPFVSDAENFPKLLSLLKEEYYINRFKAMLK